MPYEDDYKMWLEKMLIESNPDWVCDGMYDVGLTHEWCEKYCGEDSEYVTPKCLHMYYHHIARADRKTENSSEKPNNCEDLQDWKDRMWAEAIVTEPTISKMEQVDKDINVRSKDEPQTADCPFDDDAIPCEWVCTEYGKCKYKPKDEPQPQTCSFSDCDNFKNPDYERCIECKRKQIKLKTEQTERSE